MNLDKDLKFAEKYNWWSEDKEAISKETKLSYIMTRWDIYEVYYVFKNFDLNDLEKWFSIVKNDNFLLKSKRRWFLNTLFQEKKLNFL